MGRRLSPRGRLTVQRPGAWAVAVALLGVAVLLGLGTWQVQRLQWKTALLAQVDERLAAEPASLPADMAGSAVEDWAWRAVETSGTFRHGASLFRRSQVHDGDVGVAVITPLERPDGATVLVRRGWLPEKAAFEDPATARPSGRVTVRGHVRPAAEKGLFTPDNEPEANNWFWSDVPAMAAAIDRAGASLPIIVQESPHSPAMVAGDGQYPVPQRLAGDLPNNHLQYAITWYSLAAALIVIFILKHIRRTTPPGGRAQA